jgi:integrase
LGPTGWNHVRRAVSAFLTAQLGGKLKGKYHAFRLDIMAAIEVEEEAERTPDLTVERFWEVLAHVPEPLQPCYVAMAAGGLGPGEYLRAEAHHLMPLTRGLRVLGTKLGRQGENVVYFGERTWEWVRRAVPCPVGQWTLRDTWRRACKAVGQPDNRLYDLRHCAAQWATDEGVSEARVGTMMRHKTASMTRRYTRSHDKRQTADALDHAMLGKKAG